MPGQCLRSELGNTPRCPKVARNIKAGFHQVYSFLTFRKLIHIVSTTFCYYLSKKTSLSSCYVCFSNFGNSTTPTTADSLLWLQWYADSPGGGSFGLGSWGISSAVRDRHCWLDSKGLPVVYPSRRHSKAAWSKSSPRRTKDYSKTHVWKQSGGSRLVWYRCQWGR